MGGGNIEADAVVLDNFGVRRRPSSI